jgi:hypothetical protein
MPTFGWVYSNGADAIHASTAATTHSGVFYQETATAITGATAIPTTNSAVMTSSPTQSALTPSGTVPATGSDIWIVNQTNSFITVATATTMGIEGGISKNMIKATAEKWAKKEAFLAACEYAGAIAGGSAWVPTEAKVSTAGDWTFMDGAAATMAGASLVAAAALLF